MAARPTEPTAPKRATKRARKTTDGGEEDDEDGGEEDRGDSPAKTRRRRDEDRRRSRRRRRHEDGEAGYRREVTSERRSERYGDRRTSAREAPTGRRARFTRWGRRFTRTGSDWGSTRPGGRAGMPNRDYAKLLHEDLALRCDLKKRFAHAGVSKIEIERAANKLKIDICTSRPGIIIGRKGTEVDKLKTEIRSGPSARSSSISRRSRSPSSTRSSSVNRWPCSLRSVSRSAGRCGRRWSPHLRFGRVGSRFGSVGG